MKVGVGKMSSLCVCICRGGGICPPEGTPVLDVHSQPLSFPPPHTHTLSPLAVVGIKSRAPAPEEVDGMGAGERLALVKERERRGEREEERVMGKEERAKGYYVVSRYQRGGESRRWTEWRSDARGGMRGGGEEREEVAYASPIPGATLHGGGALTAGTEQPPALPPSSPSAVFAVLASSDANRTGWGRGEAECERDARLVHDYSAGWN